MQKIGLFFGTFDPIHKGHLQLATYFVEQTDLDVVWFVITPQNPFKQDRKILPNTERLELVSLALQNHSKLEISTVEFDLPQPNYTYHTLTVLKKQHPQQHFVLLLGADTMTAFDRWKDYEKIISAFELYIYPRKIAEPIPKLFLNHPKIHWTDAPIIEISSSEIRQGIENGEDMSAWVPPASWNYLTEKNLYQ